MGSQLVYLCRIILDFFYFLMHIPPWLQKSFKFTVLRLLENTVVSKKNESVHFYSCVQPKLSPRFLLLPPRLKEVAHFPQTGFLKNLFFASRTMEDYGAEKLTRIKLGRVLVTTLINSTIFAAFTFLVSVLLCHN